MVGTNEGSSMLLLDGRVLLGGHNQRKGYKILVIGLKEVNDLSSVGSINSLFYEIN